MKAEDVVEIACQQLKTSETFKQPRMAEILENEKMLAGEVKPALQGRFNIPFDSVVANGFVDTLVAQVNRPPRLEFYDDKGSHLREARKITAMWDKDSSNTRGKWAKKDRLSKRLCAISNIGIFKYQAVSDPKYKSILQVVDHYDFHCEPNGGGNLEEHVFAGQTNIFKTKSDLSNSMYNKQQVELMLSRYSDTNYKKNEDLYRNKVNRMAAAKLDIENNSYIGSQLYNLAEWVTEINGERYYVLFDYCTKTWIRFALLKEIFESELMPWVVWNARENSFNLWSRGPFDDIKPIAEAMRINLNEILNNNRKRNWDMKAVDTKMFPDLRQLDYRPDGVAVANVPLNQRIQDGIYHFQTPEISGAINLNNYLNNFMGEKSGINSQTQGVSSEDTVGIYQGNEFNVSRRMKLIGDSYDEAYADLGLRYDWGLYEHCPEDEMVKLIGPDGAEWEALKQEDTEPDYNLRVISTTNEMAEEIAEEKMRLAALTTIEANPLEMGAVNPKVLIEMKLELSDFDNSEIKRLLDTENSGNEEIMSEARNAIEQILLGKEPKINRGATTDFLQVISDFITEKTDIKEEERATLQAYFDQHVPIAAENAFKKQQKALAEMPPVGPDGAPMAPGAPADKGIASPKSMQTIVTT